MLFMLWNMHIQEDLDTMFSKEIMPLGHRRKIKTAVKNMKSAIDTGSHEHHLPIVEEKVRNVEMKSSWLKMKENFGSVNLSTGVLYYYMHLISHFIFSQN
jgi:hypothetical protein